MTRTCVAAAAVLIVGAAFSIARAEEAAPAPAPAAVPLDQALPGNTLAAVIFMPHEAPKGGGSLYRLMVQAFMRQNGTALVRRWDPDHDAYTAPGEGHWTLSGTTLCLDAQTLGPVPRLCFEVHMWGTRIAGNTLGGDHFAMIDGDIEAGNSIVAAR